MNPEPKNVSFWIWHSPAEGSSGWVKLKMKPGQEFSWSEGCATDEGWHSSVENYHYLSDEGAILYGYGSSGVDCDGRHDDGGECICPINNLKSKDAYIGIDDGDIIRDRLPEWEDCESWQRDQFAEMAGY